LKAAVLESLKNIKVKEIETPECREGEVLLELKACGICRTDMKCFTRGQRDLKMPRILGHEITGTVARVETVGKKEKAEKAEKTKNGTYGLGGLSKSKELEKIKTGDRLQVSPGITCGECDYCLQGRDNLCNHLRIMGFNYNGGFAQYLLVPARGVENGVLNKIPPHLSFKEASMTEPLACCINMQESLQIDPGNTVLIFGGGRLGILNAKLARTKGAEKIILIEPEEKRFLGAKEAKEFDYYINPLKTDALRDVMKITKHKGADVVIPCCPDPEAFNSGLQMAAKRGSLGYFSGITPADNSTQIDINLIHYKEIYVSGGYGCSINHNKTALELLASGTIKVKDMLGRTIGLDEIEKGLHMVENMTELSVTVLY